MARQAIKPMPFWLVYGPSSLDKNTPLKCYGGYPTKRLAEAFALFFYSKHVRIVPGRFVPKNKTM